jgi:hypothetical protein
VFRCPLEQKLVEPSLHIFPIFSHLQIHQLKLKCWTYSLLSSLRRRMSLCSIPSKEEVFEAFNCLGSTKAPGLDGFTAFCYKKYWSFTKAKVLLCIWNFFKNNYLLRGQNHTFVALVSKLSGSYTTHQFRPISLCNIVYKIISKILSNKLKIFLLKIISPLRSTFVPIKTYKITQLWLMGFFTLLNPKEENVVTCFSKWI